MNKSNIIILSIATILLIPMEMKTMGWVVLVLGLVNLLFCDKEFRGNIFLVYISIGVLGITPITTDIGYMHTFKMGFLLFLTVAIPYYVSRFIYKNKVISYKFHHGRAWTRKEIGYIFLAGFLAYILLPFCLFYSGSYFNWTISLGTLNIIRLFIGTNVLGIWDELFFINTTLSIFRHHFSFLFSNIAQSILFTSFLYELGFRGWMCIIIFIFAVLQGYVFKKTESLLYVVAIHLSVDFVLFLTLIHLHHPELLKIFFI